MSGGKNHWVPRVTQQRASLFILFPGCPSHKSSALQDPNHYTVHTGTERTHGKNVMYSLKMKLHLKKSKSNVAIFERFLLKKPMQLGPSWVSVTPCIIITVLPKLLHFAYMFLSSVLNSLNNETCYSSLCTSNTLDSAWSMRVQ